MKAKLIVLAVLFAIVSCNSKPSLEKYIVDNSENKNFIQLDVTPNFLNIDKSKLTVEQVKAFNSFEKVNILAFKINTQNQKEFEHEKEKVATILKDEKYQQLMKIGSGKDAMCVSFVGDDAHISEFVVFGTKIDAGFAVIRILGKDMNPAAVMNFMDAIKNSNTSMEQFQPFLNQFKK